MSRGRSRRQTRGGVEAVIPMAPATDGGAAAATTTACLLTLFRQPDSAANP